MAVLVCMGMGAAAHAHRVAVFAWVEGETVHVESKFPGGKKVQEGRVLVYDSGGKLLLEGETDEHGAFDFQVPAKSSLKVVLEAGVGHRAEWTIPAEEVEGALPERPENAGPVHEAGQPEPAEPGRVNGGVNPQDIETAVERALDKKLQPIVRTLAALQDEGPSVSDILGGIGYILGLMGLAAYVHYRRKARETEGGTRRAETG